MLSVSFHARAKYSLIRYNTAPAGPIEMSNQKNTPNTFLCVVIKAFSTASLAISSGSVSSTSCRNHSDKSLRASATSPLFKASCMEVK